jgi:hypothetical protein
MPAIIEGHPHWPPVAVATWLEAARTLGVDAADRTYEQIDSLRDGDDCYAGTVQVGRELLDLYVDAGVLRVAPRGPLPQLSRRGRRRRIVLEGWRAHSVSSWRSRERERERERDGPPAPRPRQSVPTARGSP